MTKKIQTTNLEPYVQQNSLSKMKGRASLVAQREESFGQCRRVGFDPWSRKIPHATEQLSLCTTTIGPVSTAWEPKLLNPICPRTCAPPQWEAHTPQLESGPCLLQLEKIPHSNEDPVQPKIKINTYIHKIIFKRHILFFFFNGG